MIRKRRLDELSSKTILTDERKRRLLCDCADISGGAFIKLKKKKKYKNVTETNTRTTVLGVRLFAGRMTPGKSKNVKVLSVFPRTVHKTPTGINTRSVIYYYIIAKSWALGNNTKKSIPRIT